MRCFDNCRRLGLRRWIFRHVVTDFGPMLSQTILTITCIRFALLSLVSLSFSDSRLCFIIYVSRPTHKICSLFYYLFFFIYFIINYLLLCARHRVIAIYLFYLLFIYLLTRCCTRSPLFCTCETLNVWIFFCLI